MSCQQLPDVTDHADDISAAQLCVCSCHGSPVSKCLDTAMDNEWWQHRAECDSIASTSSSAAAAGGNAEHDCSTDTVLRRWGRHACHTLPGQHEHLQSSGFHPLPGLDAVSSAKDAHTGITQKANLPLCRQPCPMTVPAAVNMHYQMHEWKGLPCLINKHGQRTVFWCVRRTKPSSAPLERDWGWLPAWHDAASVVEQELQTCVCLWVYTKNNAKRGWSCNRCDHDISDPMWIPMHGPWCSLDSHSSLAHSWCKEVPATNCCRRTKHPGGFYLDRDGQTYPVTCSHRGYASRRHDCLYWPSAREVVRAMRMWEYMTMQASLGQARSRQM